MAELYRKRYNGVDSVTLGAAISSSGATSITFAAALQSMGANIATLATDEYLPLVIDNEILYLTAYTAAATTGTISRGKEGTTAATHSNGAAVVHGPTVTDYTGPINVDNLTAFNTSSYGSTGTNFEMEGSGTSLPSGLSWVNQGATTVEENLGALVMRIPAVAGDNMRCIVGSLTGTTWTAVAKLSIPPRLVSSADVQNYGMVIRDSAAGKLLSFSIINDPLTKLIKWNSATSFSAFAASAAWNDVLNGFPAYWRIKKNSATSYDFAMSYDGVAWQTFFTGHDVSAWLTTPDQVGYYITYNGNKIDEMACHWLRFRT